MKVFTLAKLIITIPLCLDVDSLPDAICSVCDCQPDFGVFCRGEEISGLMSDETLHLGMDFPIIDLRSSEGLRKGMVHCETVFGSTKILLSGSGVRCGELLTYSSLTYCDHEIQCWDDGDGEEGEETSSIASATTTTNNSTSIWPFPPPTPRFFNVTSPAPDDNSTNSEDVEGFKSYEIEVRLELIIPLSLLTISAAVLVIKRLVKWVRKRCRDRNVAGEDVEMNVLGGEDEDESELQLYPPPVATATSFLPGFCHLFQQRRGGRNVVYIPRPHTSRGRGIARGMEHIERSMTGAMTHLTPPPHDSFDSLSEFLKNKPESVAGAGGGDSSETLVEVDIGQGYASGSSSGSGNSSIFPGGYNDGSKKKRR